MKTPYTKMHGCRNDYIYFDNIGGDFPQLQKMDLGLLSKRLSNRQSGIGSDGIIILDKPSAANVAVGALARMGMYNADGSEGKMCGNGIRCVAKLLYERFGPRPSYKVETLSGMRECFVLDSSRADQFVVKVNMGRPSFMPDKIPVLFEDVMVMEEEFDVLDRSFKVSCVSIGNPHCVIEVEDLDAFDVAKYGPSIEKHEAFPEGVNVEFIQFKGNEIFQRTWERGSGETLACGTGACAVATTLILQKKRKSPVLIHLKGGDLRVDWDGLREVWLTGEAVTESKGEIDLDLLRS